MKHDGPLDTDTTITPPTAPHVVRPACIGLALSGGGAKGDFEVGVVRYLYGRGVRPQVICGTSVGAINALKLAEGEPAKAGAPGPDGHLQGLAGLEDIWMKLRKDEDMWSVSADVTEVVKAIEALEAKAGELKGDVFAVLANAIHAAAVPISAGPGPISLFVSVVETAVDAGDAIKQVELIAERLKNARSLANLNPIYQTMCKPSSFKPDLVKASRIKLRLATVGLERGSVRYVDETGELLERDGTRTGVKIGDPQKIAALAKEIKDSEALLGEFETNTPAYNMRKSALATLKRKLAAATNEAQFRLQIGALASSALPVIFPPEAIGDDWYVDGGIRMVTPVEAAIRAGATQVYAISANAAETAKAGSFDPPKGLLDIGARVSMSLLPDEVALNNLFPLNGWGVPVMVIAPEVDIHDALTIDPGLIDIRMDHGFMRADDTWQAYAQDPANYRELTLKLSKDRKTTEIIRLRRKIWGLEFDVAGRTLIRGKSFPPTPHKIGSKLAISGALDKIREEKSKLRTLVEARIAAGGQCPAGYERWWLDWEKHPWTQAPLLRSMTASIRFTQQPSGSASTFRVTAKDDLDGTTITGASVVVDHKTIGTTGEPLTYNFKSKVHVDPETHERETILPAIWVSKSGYEPAFVPGYEGG